jgi:hypothetical protein
VLALLLFAPPAPPAPLLADTELLPVDADDAVLVVPVVADVVVTVVSDGFVPPLDPLAPPPPGAAPAPDMLVSPTVSPPPQLAAKPPRPIASVIEIPNRSWLRMVRGSALSSVIASR